MYIIGREKGTPWALGRELPLESSQKHEGYRSSKRKCRHCWARSANFSLDFGGERFEVTATVILFSHLLNAAFIDRRRNQIDRTKV